MTRRQHKWCGGNGVDLRTCMQQLLQHQRLDQVFHQPRRWTHQCCGWWHRFSRFSGYDIVGCSAKEKQHPCQQWWNGKALIVVYGQAIYTTVRMYVYPMLSRWNASYEYRWEHIFRKLIYPTLNRRHGLWLVERNVDKYEYYLSSSFPFVRGEVLPAPFSPPHLIVLSTLLCILSSSSSSLSPPLPSSHLS